MKDLSSSGKQKEKRILRRKFIKSSLCAAGGLGLLLSIKNDLLAAEKAVPELRKTSASHPNYRINKREMMLSVLDRSKPNRYVPAAFFMHFGGDYRRGEAAINRHLEYFRATNMDFLKVQYEISMPRQAEIKRPEDWAKLPIFDKNFFEPVLAVIAGIVKEAKSEALIIPTIYSPFNCAAQMVGMDNVVAHGKENPEAVSKGMQRITESILNYVREAIRLGADGFYMSTQGSESNHFDNTSFYTKLTRPADMAILQECSDNSLFNILHICDWEGRYNQLDHLASYPASVINAPFVLADGSPIIPKETEKLFNRPVMGGLNRLGTLAKGSVEEIKKEIDKVMPEVPQNFILAADCTVPASTPWETLRSVIDYAHTWRMEHA